jgi:small subunit ribosomal protein S21
LVRAGRCSFPSADRRSSKDDRMTEVRLDEGDSVDRALKLFRRKLQKTGLFKELRRRRYYVKPSAARLLKSAAARRRKRKRPPRDAW